MITYNSLVPELSVSDINKSLEFYTCFLPFKIEYERQTDKFAFLSIGNAQIMIEEINGHWQTGELTRPFGRGVNFQIEVDDVEKLHARLVSSGYPIEYEIAVNCYEARGGTVRQKEFLVKDPDGYLLRFSETL